MPDRSKKIPVRTVKELLEHAEEVRQTSMELVRKMKKLEADLREEDAANIERQKKRARRADSD